ncbi:MAG: hypothetical protein GY708_07465 [Actinomycetia bacterium]|nr:hypothetical protein [Actinomycetes bacterium]
MRRWFRRGSVDGSSDRSSYVAGIGAEIALGVPIEHADVVDRVRSIGALTVRSGAHAVVLARLLNSMPSSDLLRLDHDVRWKESWRVSVWDSLTAGKAQKLMSGATDEVAVAAALSMHRSGWIRESAVHVLGHSGDLRSVRWLVPRCGDWVPQVRDAAHRFMDPWLSSSTPRCSSTRCRFSKAADSVRIGARTI